MTAWVLGLVALAGIGIGVWWARSRTPRTATPTGTPASGDRWQRMMEVARAQAADPFARDPVEVSVMVQGLSRQAMEEVLGLFRQMLAENAEALGITDPTDREALPDLRYREDPDWVMRLDGLTAPQARTLIDRVRQAGGRARARTFFTREKGFQMGDDLADLEVEFAVWTRARPDQDIGALSRHYAEFSRQNARTLGLNPEDLDAAGEPEVQGDAQVWQPLAWEQAWTLYQEARRLQVPAAIRGLLPFPGD